MRRRLRALHGRIAALGRDERGVSAVEFAMLLPLMITLYLGGVEVSQAVSIDRKVTLAGRVVGDLVTQNNNVTNAMMTNFLNAGKTVTAPYPDSKLKLKVSSIVVNDQLVAKVAWSDALNTTARTPGENVILPSTLLVKGKALVWTEVSYDYTPSIGYVITGTITLKWQGYMVPRKQDAPISRSAT